MTPLSAHDLQRRLEAVWDETEETRRLGLPVADLEAEWLDLLGLYERQCEQERASAE